MSTQPPIPDSDTISQAGSIAAILGLLATNNVEAAQVMWKNAPEGLRAPVDHFINQAMERFNLFNEDLWTDVLNIFRENNFIDQNDMDSLMSLRNLQTPVNFIALAYTVISLLTNIITSRSAPAMEHMIQEGLAASRPTLPDPSTSIHAAFIAPEKTAEVRQYLARYGYSEDAIDLMFLGQYRLYDETTIRELYLRQIINEDRMFERMRELGYTDTRIQELTQAWSLIPPVQDILMMVGREAFEPDSVEAMGLDDEFPTEVSPWLRQQGLSDYWQHNYWRAHWQQPSIQMGFEMFHRDVINREELEFLFRTVEIPPYWRSRLLAITYTRLTRVDVRRMHKLGVLDDEGVIRAYRDLGYSDEDAALMGEYTVRANMGAEKDLNKTEVLKAFKIQAISAQQTQQYLIRLGYDENEAEFIVAMAEYDRERETGKLIEDNIEKRYKARLISESEARDELDRTGMPATQRSALIEKWKLSLIQNPKVPSKTDLEDFYRAGIISLDVYRVEMDRLGYSSQYTDWYAQLAFKQGPRYGAAQLEQPE